MVRKQLLRALISYKTGEYFSAQKVADTEKAIAKYLGRDGYAYPQVVTKPQLNKAGTHADLTIHVDPGNLMSVRRINFLGNVRLMMQYCVEKCVKWNPHGSRQN